MKIPIQNIYYLLCYAWNKLEERDLVDVKAIDSTKLVDLFAKVLIAGIAHLLKRGVDRNYILFNDELRTIRGKIDFPTTLSRNLLQRVKVQCNYDEMSHDVLHNQILRATIYKLILVDELDENLRDELIRLFRYFYKISEIKINSKTFQSVRLNRNNYFYKFLLNICELVYENLLPSEETGETSFKDFLRDDKKMAYLFEDFIRNFYKLELKDKKVTREDIHWGFTQKETDFEIVPKMQTDVTILSSNKKIIIETKYYSETLIKYYGEKKLRTQHLYQLYAYLKQVEYKDEFSRNAEGILLYPLVNDTVNFSKELEGHRIKISTVNLNQDWQLIHKDLLSLVA